MKPGCSTHSFTSRWGASLGSPVPSAGSWFTPSLPRHSPRVLCLSFMFAFQLKLKNSTHSKAKLKPAHSSREMKGRTEGMDPLLTYCPDAPGEDGEPGNHRQLAMSFCSSSSSQPEKASLTPSRSQEPVRSRVPATEQAPAGMSSPGYRVMG